jgi:hypothetical protein
MGPICCSRSVVQSTTVRLGRDWGVDLIGPGMQTWPLPKQRDPPMSGQSRRRHPKVLTLLEQNDRVGLCPRWVSGKIPVTVRGESSIARQAIHHCAPLQVGHGRTGQARSPSGSSGTRCDRDGRGSGKRFPRIAEVGWGGAFGAGFAAFGH